MLGGWRGVRHGAARGREGAGPIDDRRRRADDRGLGRRRHHQRGGGRGGRGGGDVGCGARRVRQRVRPRAGSRAPRRGRPPHGDLGFGTRNRHGEHRRAVVRQRRRHRLRRAHGGRLQPAVDAGCAGVLPGGHPRVAHLPGGHLHRPHPGRNVHHARFPGGDRELPRVRQRRPDRAPRASRRRRAGAGLHPGPAVAVAVVPVVPALHGHYRPAAGDSPRLGDRHRAGCRPAARVSRGRRGARRGTQPARPRRRGLASRARAAGCRVWEPRPQEFRASENSQRDRKVAASQR